MRKCLYIFIMMLSGAFLSGCTDSSYRGQYDLYHAGHSSSKIPVWIKIGETADLTSRTLTRGSGVIDNAEGLTDNDFHIYAFSKDQKTSYKTSSLQDELNTLLDASIDDPTSLAGRSATWNKMYERVVWKDGKDVYWPISQAVDHRYDFFAYYVDDMHLTAGSYHRTDDEVNIDIEIDGMQDLMSAKAEPSDVRLDAMFMDEMDKALYKHYYCYSYKSAMVNLQPEFVFNHHLTKIRFKLMPGVTSGQVNQITLHGINVESKYKGTFRVASKKQQQGMKFDSKEVRKFALKEEDGSQLDTTVIKTLKSANSDERGEDLGGYLLIAPSVNGYWIEMDMSEIRDLEGPNEQHLSRMKYTTFIYRGLKESPDPFEPGNEYTVTLHVYGREDVRVNIEVEEWKPGGYIIPDTEDGPPDMPDTEDKPDIN